MNKVEDKTNQIGKLLKLNKETIDDLEAKQTKDLVGGAGIIDAVMIINAVNAHKIGPSYRFNFDTACI